MVSTWMGDRLETLTVDFIGTRYRLEKVFFICPIFVKLHIHMKFHKKLHSYICYPSTTGRSFLTSPSRRILVSSGKGHVIHRSKFKNSFLAITSVRIVLLTSNLLQNFCLLILHVLIYITIMCIFVSQIASLLLHYICHVIYRSKFKNRFLFFAITSRQNCHKDFKPETKCLYCNSECLFILFSHAHMCIINFTTL